MEEDDREPATTDFETERNEVAMASKSPKLSKRQALLLERLIAFCGRCGSPDLPLRIVKVIGYGSFFRGKERPGDVDLFVVTGQNHPLFEKFRSLLKLKLSRHRGGSKLPSDRMRKIAASDPDPVVAQAGGMFVRWVEGFSDAMLFEHKSMVDELFAHEPQRFARRILHTGLPGINALLDRELDKPVSKVVHVIWSPEQPDVKSTVEQIWLSDQRPSLISELRTFEEKARPHLLQIAILNQVADHLARSRLRIVDTEEVAALDRYNKWLKTQHFDYDAKICVEATDRILSRHDCENQPNLPGLETLNLKAIGTDGLRNLADEKRQGLKMLYDRAFVLRLSTNSLALWCFLDKRRSRLSKRDYLVSMVTESIPMREVKPKRVQEILNLELERLGIA